MKRIGRSIDVGAQVGLSSTVLPRRGEKKMSIIVVIGAWAVACAIVCFLEKDLED